MYGQQVSHQQVDIALQHQTSCCAKHMIIFVKSISRFQCIFDELEITLEKLSWASACSISTDKGRGLLRVFPLILYDFTNASISVFLSDTSLTILVSLAANI